MRFPTPSGRVLDFQIVPLYGYECLVQWNRYGWRIFDMVEPEGGLIHHRRLQRDIMLSVGQLVIFAHYPVIQAICGSRFWSHVGPVDGTLP